MRSAARVVRVDAARAIDPLAAMLSTLKPWLSRSHGPNPPTTAALEALLPRGLQAEVRHYLAEPARAYTAPSGIKDAGAGLFAMRRVRPGEILTLFPSVVHPPSLSLPEGAVYARTREHRALLADPSYARGLSDDAPLDGTPGLLDACTVFRHRSARDNALGHLANHPPRGRPPNMLMVDIMGYGWESLRLVALVAVDPMAAGTEALLDYGQACPGVQHPESWYEAVPREQAACVRALARGQARAMYGL
tara:strand:+ start:143 stop:889 length:747 start_codon:yes stop_codon:yes gene_type:complete|mmetsp:Transcript_50479/g.121357  ORF Transcript_50479/g.121357 Transcript_50479/m.121357 type:complete len:249 (-) Transcript_50479:78-824(-)